MQEEMHCPQHPAPSSPDLLSVEIEVKRQILRETFETRGEELIGILASYIASARTASALGKSVGQIGELAGDALTDLFDEAMKSAAKYDLSRPPMAWLLGLGKFIVLRQRERLFRAHNRSRNQEQSWSDLPRSDDNSDIEEVFDRLTQHAAHVLHSPLEHDAALHALLEPLNTDERDIVTRCVLNQFDSATVAGQLNIAPATARKRLQRALDKLRSNHRSDKISMLQSARTPDNHAAEKATSRKIASSQSASYRSAVAGREVKADA